MRGHTTTSDWTRIEESLSYIESYVPVGPNCKAKLDFQVVSLKNAYASTFALSNGAVLCKGGTNEEFDRGGKSVVAS